MTPHSLSGKDVQRLASSIQRLKQLHLFDRSGNGSRIRGVLAVAACLSELPDLVELNVRDNNISRSDVGNANEYLYQHVWMALRMFREREGRVLIADPCVHGVLEERIHLLHPRFHIGWQLVMKKLHDVEEKERTILELGKTCQFLHDVVGQYYLHVADGLSLRNDDDLDSCQQYLPDVIPYTTFEYPDRGRNNEKKMHNLSRLLRRCIRLKTLNLPIETIGRREMRRRAPSVQEMSKMKELYPTELTWDEEAQILAPALAVMAQLEELNFSLNRFTVEGVKALAPALQVMTHMKKLNLRCNWIDEEGAIALAPALQVMTQLTVLKMEQEHWQPHCRL